jgi:hypothetical protein
MEILRVPPYPIITTWELPIPNYEYILYVEDLVDHSVEETNITSDENGIVVYELPLTKVEYDRHFFVKFYDAEHIHTLYEENLDIIRPYANPNKMGTTASEVEEYKMYELIARSVIDQIIPDGFYNTKHIIQKTGTGTDYFAVWKDVNKVLRVYENNVLVYDVDTPSDNVYDYIITLDNSAIQRVVNGRFNRSESMPPNLIQARGDLGYYGFDTVAFPSSYDYIFIVDAGYRTVPADVEQGTKMFIEDIRSGKLDYYNRYIKNYQTDQFQVEFMDKVINGTGNLLLDKILDKYSNNILKPGII